MLFGEGPTLVQYILMIGGVLLAVVGLYFMFWVGGTLSLIVGAAIALAGTFSVIGGAWGWIVPEAEAHYTPPKEPSGIVEPKPDQELTDLEKQLEDLKKEATKEETTEENAAQQEPTWGKLGGQQTPTTTAPPEASMPTASSEQYTSAPESTGISEWDRVIPAPTDQVGVAPWGNATERHYVPAAGGEAMQAYVDALNTGDYDAMYYLLHPWDQNRFTLEEWRYANDQIGTDQSHYVLADVLVVDEYRGESWPRPAGQAVVEVTVPTGEVVTKYYWFEWNDEAGAWVHWLNGEETELLYQYAGL
jgi:hypothetical protein